MLISLKDLVTLTQTVIGQDLNASLEKRGIKGRIEGTFADRLPRKFRI